MHRYLNLKGAVVSIDVRGPGIRGVGSRRRTEDKSISDRTPGGWRNTVLDRPFHRM